MTPIASWTTIEAPPSALQLSFPKIVQTPLNASATSVGSLLGGSTFVIPPFQREYSWEQDEVADFWTDLKHGMSEASYFLGLIIVYEEGSRKHVVDGQQRILSVTLLAAALYQEAKARGRIALAERLQAGFLESIDYATDDTHPRVVLSDDIDNRTFQAVLNGTPPPASSSTEENPISRRIVEAYQFLTKKLREDIDGDAFKRLGSWTEFLTNRVYVAVFVHPNASAAYRVYEVVNTRGKDLSTADLLKNHILSNTPTKEREHRYQQWQLISRQFDSPNAFVQYIRHVVTVQAGHILPQDLFDFVAQRKPHSSKKAPTPSELVQLLEDNLALYLQMIDPSLAGPADEKTLEIFSALRSLQVIAVRPILLAMFAVPQGIEGMHFMLRLVVRRIVASTLGTGNVERRFGEAARFIREEGSWTPIHAVLRDLNPAKEDFVQQLAKRSYNKQLLTFMRRSIITGRDTPSSEGTMHFILPKHLPTEWKGITEEEGAFWASTIGNTFLSSLDRRPLGATDWDGFKAQILPTGVHGEWMAKLQTVPQWNAGAIESIGRDLAEAAGNVWY